MEGQTPSVFTSSNDEGVKKAQREDYAYLMESTSIEYIIQRECDLQMIGGLLDNKGYGIALPPGKAMLKG